MRALGKPRLRRRDDIGRHMGFRSGVSDSCTRDKDGEGLRVTTRGPIIGGMHNDSTRKEG